MGSPMSRASTVIKSVEILDIVMVLECHHHHHHQQQKGFFVFVFDKAGSRGKLKF